LSTTSGCTNCGDIAASLRSALPLTGIDSRLLRFGSDQHLDKVQRHFLDSHSTNPAQQTPWVLSRFNRNTINHSNG
jgi:hypothetical protein